MKKVLLALSLLSYQQHSLAETTKVEDPVLTADSLATFDLDFLGMKVQLPVELKPRAQVKDYWGTSGSLEIGNVDIDFQPDSDDEEGHITGWIEFGAAMYRCKAADEMKKIKSLFHDLEGLKGTIDKIKNQKFTGYVVKSEVLEGGDTDFMSYRVINEPKSICYNFNFSVRDFNNDSAADVKGALRPLTRNIEISLDNYTH